MLVSCPERTILEILDEIPTILSLEHAAEMFSGVSSLSPRQLRKSGEDCGNVTGNRLFLSFPERHDHALFKSSNLSQGC